jgi:hypothetical protein
MLLPRSPRFTSSFSNCAQACGVSSPNFVTRSRLASRPSLRPNLRCRRCRSG